MFPVVVNVDSPADILAGYGAGAVIRVERDTTSAFAAPTEITTIPVVATTRQYEYWDANGTSAHYYRTRFSKAVPTQASHYSDYSTVFRAGQLQAYATLDDLKETMNFGASDASKDNMLSDLLVDASNYIDRMTSRSFYRFPQVSGTETRTYQIVNSGEKSLQRAIGIGLDIASITTLEVTTDLVGTTWTTLASGSTGYYFDPLNPETGWPYEDVRLSSEGSVYTTFPYRGQVRIVGAFGFASVPPMIKRATIDLAREWYRQGPGGGGPIGMSALGQPQFQRGDPPTVRQAIALFKRQDFLYV